MLQRAQIPQTLHARVFAFFDTDHDLTVSFDEYCYQLLKLRSHKARERAKYLFFVGFA